MRLYTTPTNLERNKYGHAAHPDLHTDPYGGLGYAVGNSDDFICFDFAIASIEGETYVALHATVNSETGSFIEDFDYIVIKDAWLDDGAALQEAANMVSQALDWCAFGGDKPIQHDKKGWNQDPYFFVRDLARAMYRHGMESEEIAALSRRDSWFRFGSKTLNSAIARLCPGLVLPVSRRPQPYSSSL